MLSVNDQNVTKICTEHEGWNMCQSFVFFKNYIKSVCLAEKKLLYVLGIEPRSSRIDDYRSTIRAMRLRRRNGSIRAVTRVAVSTETFVLHKYIETT